MSKPKTVLQSEGGAKDVEFRCIAPGAQAVFLAGTFNSWESAATPMQADNAGEWCAVVALPPGRYEYKYVVDGLWCCEPGIADREDYAGEDTTLNVFGTRNRVLEVE